MVFQSTMIGRRRGILDIKLVVGERNAFIFEKEQAYARRRRDQGEKGVNVYELVDQRDLRHQCRISNPHGDVLSVYMYILKGNRSRQITRLLLDKPWRTRADNKRHALKA